MDASNRGRTTTSRTTVMTTQYNQCCWWSSSSLLSGTTLTTPTMAMAVGRRLSRPIQPTIQQGPVVHPVVLVRSDRSSNPVGTHVHTIQNELPTDRPTDQVPVMQTIQHTHTHIYTHTQVRQGAHTFKSRDKVVAVVIDKWREREQKGEWETTTTTTFPPSLR